MSIEKVATIQSIYAAFGSGDVPGILSLVAPDTRWDFNGGRAEVPWHAVVEGKDRLPAFFGAMAENMEFHKFEPREFIHAGPHVVVEVQLEYTVRKTGKRVKEDQLQWWTLDDQNRVVRLRHFEDTAQVLEAVRK
jgi:ketosteroid isomerase-like protein